MYKQLFLSAALFAASLQANAQSTATDYKGGNNNPISASVFCADPTALEYNGRLYVYGTNDHQEFIKNGKKGDNSYGSIKSMVVFSTADMVNWTFHGTIDAQKLCATWTGTPWYKGFMNSWAPSVTWRTNPDTGKDEFFLYFANTSHGVGVLTADSPTGPWKSPLKESLINKDTPGALQQSANFDPGVVIDDNGTGWLTFGGLDPDKGGTNFMPNNTRIIKLQPSMTAIDGEAILIPAPYHFEANELNIIDGKFAFTYCSNWSRDEAEWNAYTSEHHISAPQPNVGTMCYMVSDNPTDPDSWVYRDVYGPHPGTSGNNHSHLHKFKGNYYHIYHSGALLEAMKKADGLDAGGYRSICVDKAKVNEATQTINKVTLTAEGVEAVGTLNPYEEQQAETMATCAGISYEDFTNIKKNGRINALGNEVSENMQVRMAEDSWIQLRKVDFGDKGAARFTLRAKGEGTIEVRIGRRGAKPSATIAISSDEMSDYTVDVDAAKFIGQKSIFFMATSGTEVWLDAWQFAEDQPDAIHGIVNRPSEADKSVNRKSYDLQGRQLSGSRQHRGIVIEQYTDENGLTHTRKRL